MITASICGVFIGWLALCGLWQRRHRLDTEELLDDTLERLHRAGFKGSRLAEMWYAERGIDRLFRNGSPGGRL